jgi:hypothetical protein
MTRSGDLERLYDELSGHREKPPQSNEYDPYDPLGLRSGRVTCTMATLVDPWDEATAEVFTQDGNGNWIVDEESKNSRDMLIQSYRQWL